MRNQLHITLFGALLLGVCVLLFSVTALPASAATLGSTTASHSTAVSKSPDVQVTVVPDSRPDYNRGFRYGRSAGDYECKTTAPSFRGYGRYESDYTRGYVDGFNFAVGHDSFCQHSR